MKKYYIEFQTWREGTVEMPGTYKVLGESSEYRSRYNLNKAISAIEVRNVFLSFNEKKIDTFLNENVAACIVAIIVDADSEESAVSLLDQNFGPIIVDGILEVNDSTIEEVKKVMGDKLNEPPPYLH